MTIEHVPEGTPFRQAIRNLVDNDKYLDGQTEKAKFDKNELDQLFADIEMARKFKRNQVIGNTAETYSNWVHLKAESSYSIWKYPISDFKHNSLNKMYFDGKALNYRGEANSEIAEFFDSVLFYDGSSWIDNTEKAKREGRDVFSLMSQVPEPYNEGDYLYIGAMEKFSGIDIEFQTYGLNYNLVCEYWAEDAYGYGEWKTLTISDETSKFTNSGRITFDISADWSQSTEGENPYDYYYYIRFSTNTIPVATAKAFFIMPLTGVANLLSLSISQVQNEEWACCYYNGYIYVTIRNTGQSVYEGSYYIASSSSETNKENFFVHNHQYDADYEDKNYTAPATTLEQRIANIEAYLGIY